MTNSNIVPLTEEILKLRQILLHELFTMTPYNHMYFQTKMNEGCVRPHILHRFLDTECYLVKC
jgi:hypothetical protein